jgi:hypothetical protein
VEELLKSYRMRAKARGKRMNEASGDDSDEEEVVKKKKSLNQRRYVRST